MSKSDREKFWNAELNESEELSIKNEIKKDPNLDNVLSS
jgi:hypothetical protein